MAFGRLGSAFGRMGGAGKSTGGAARLVLSGSSQAENTAIGTTIGTLAVVGGTGVYTLSKTADPDSAFTLTGASLKNAISFDYETATSHSVTIHADNGAGSTVDGTFAIAVTDVSVTLVNTVAPAITGTEEVGSTLTCGNGTWTGGPTSFTYQWFRAITSGGSIVTSGGLFTGVAIGSATSATYLLDAADAGEKLYCEVTAHKAEAANVMAQSNATGVITAPAFETETTAWAAAVVGDGGTVSAGQKTDVNNLIVALKGYGIFSKLDRLWLFASENAFCAKRDIVAAAAATLSNAPSFTADRGYTGNGTNALINTGFNPTTAPSPKFVQDSACMFVWNNTAGADNAALIGSANNALDLYPGYGDGNCYWAINDGTNESFANAGAAGLYSADRADATAKVLYLNGSSIRSASGLSNAPPNATIKVLSDGGSFASRQACSFGNGQHLTATEQANLYTAKRAYMTARGVP